MKKLHQLFLLALLGVSFSGGIAYFQGSPGYMDADYYFAGGIQLAEGKGFNEPYLWNYLDNPDGLPHPSHAYWMPLASIIAAIGMGLAGQISWFSGRILFLIIAAIIPIITYSLAYSFSNRSDLALISGLLAIFSGFYATFIPVTDTFGIYMVLGGTFFLVAHRHEYWSNAILGLIAGLMHLARADGISWLLISFLIILWKPINNSHYPKFYYKILLSVLCLFGYLTIIGAWFIRNNLVFGTIFAPGGGTMLWLTSYNQIFSYPPDLVNFRTWIETGMQEILSVRLWAMNINLKNALASQASIFLLPLIIAGIWSFLKDLRIKIGVISWIGYMFLMSIIFPFAGARGGFFHSGASLQPMWWALAPIGLVTIVKWLGERRAWKIDSASKFFLWATVGFSILFTIYIVQGKLINPEGGNDLWSTELNLYKRVDSLIELNAQINPIVVVANPPGYYLATGKMAIAVPDGDVKTTLLVAQKFNANYLVLEKEGYPDGLMGLYNYPDHYPDFIYLGELNGARVFKIKT